MEVQNIFNIPKGNPDEQETLESLFNNKNLLIERIVTHKPYEKPGQWYDQDKDEWVVLLEGEAELEFKDEKNIKITKGDYFIIPAHKIHRIKQSGLNTKCIWLAIHGDLK